MTHSPLPWRIIGLWLVDANGNDIWSTTEDDAAFIVKAVNAHAALVAALEAIVERSRNDPLGTSKVIDMRNMAVAALELARKGGA